MVYHIRKLLSERTESTVEYYKQHGLTECQFYGWRRRYFALYHEASDKHTELKPKKKYYRYR